MLFAWVVGIASLVSACQSSEKSNGSEALAVGVVQLEELLGSKEEMRLSDLAESVSYIALETSDSCVLDPSQYVIRKNRIYIRNRNETVFLFDDKGKFVRQIGKMGSGPMEYQGVQELSVSPDGDRLYFYSTRLNKAYIYSSSGERLGEFSLKYPSWRFAALSPTRHVMISPYGDLSGLSAPFIFYLMDGAGNVIQQFPSHRVIQMNGDFGMGKFVSTPKGVLGYQPFSDTVFAFDENGDRSARFVFDYGEFRIPDAEFDDMMKLYEIRDQYIHSVSFHEADMLLFIRAYHQKKAFLGIWYPDKQNLVPVSDRDGLLLNDLDGGPDFWPAASNGENLVYRLLRCMDLVTARDGGDFSSKEFTNPALKKKLDDLLPTIHENDNPIIMVVQLKSR